MIGLNNQWDHIKHTITFAYSTYNYCNVLLYNMLYPRTCIFDISARAFLCFYDQDKVTLTS